MVLNLADLKEADLFSGLSEQRKHWYYSHKINSIRFMLDKHIRVSSDKGISSYDYEPASPLQCLDIGAGNGIIGRSLGLTIGETDAKWDLVDSAYVLDTLDDTESASFSRHLCIPNNAVYDLVVAIDVMEHVEDDRAFLRLISSHMKNGSLLIICVPAFQMLWSIHDIFLGHYRRYRRLQIVSLLRNEGFYVAESGYLYMFLFPLVTAARLMKRVLKYLRVVGSEEAGSDLKVYPDIINSLLISLMKLEGMLVKLVPSLSRLPGVSCYAVAVRN